MHKEKTFNVLKMSRGFLYIGIVLVVISPILFSLNSFCSIFDLTQTGQIGDTIGGITSPITSLIGSVLIFFALMAQVNESKNQNCDRNFEVTLDLFKQLKEDFNSLSYSAYNQVRQEREQLIGRAAIYQFTEQIISTSNNKFLTNENKINSINHYLTENIYADFYFILSTYKLILNRIHNSEIREDEKSQLLSLVNTYYITQFSEPTERIRYVLNKFQTAEIEMDSSMINIINQIQNNL